MTDPGLRSVLVPVVEASQPGEARRAAVALAEAAGLTAAEVAAVGVVATEAATNLVKHAADGQMIFRPDPDGGLEILAVDAGPGMADIERCLADGYSTAGSPGTGLGAMRRLSADFDVYSLPSSGTVVRAVVGGGRKRPPAQPASVEIGGVCVPVAGEVECGDAWAVRHDGGRMTVLVVDGLGHGPAAAEAADTAVRLFHENADSPPVDLLNRLHAGLRATRGAAAAVAVIDPAGRQVRFAGVGNIAGRILSAGDSRGLVSHNGIVGHKTHRVQEFTYPWPDDALLVLNSDGIQTQWGVDPYPGLTARHPSIVAAVLLRDFRRPKDDTTVVVARAV